MTLQYICVVALADKICKIPEGMELTFANNVTKK